MNFNRESQETPKSSTSTSPRLAVLIPNVWSIRNIVHSGALQLLSDRGVEVHLLIRQLSENVALEQGYKHAKALHLLHMPKVTRRPIGKSALDGVIYSAFMQGNEITSYPIFSKWFHRTGSDIRSRLIHFIGTLAKSPRFYNPLNCWSECLYSSSVDLIPIREQLLKIAPDLLWSTSFITGNEHAYVTVARQLHIPIIASVLSFDNLTGRTSYLFRFDHYTVWSEWMKQQLMQYYQVPSEQITVTGTPQFDFHRRTEYCWDRQSTLAFLGLSCADKYFVYGANSCRFTPDEPFLVRQLVEEMSSDQELEECKIVVRLHPLDDWARWKGQLDGLKNVILSGSWDIEPDSGGWAFITSQEQNKLISLLAHTEGCINIASTLGLDAAILDRPVIGIDFRNEPAAPQDIFYDAYHTEHYWPLVDNGAVTIARSWNELMTLMRDAVHNPEKHKNDRQRAVQQICGLVDGKATQRLVSALLDQLDQLIH